MVKRVLDILEALLVIVLFIPAFILSMLGAILIMPFELIKRWTNSWN